MNKHGPIICLENPIYLVGMKALLPAKSAGQTERVRVIQEMSRLFGGKVQEIAGRVGEERFSIIENDIEDNGAPATIGVMVAVVGFENQPKWSQEFIMPAGGYACFQHKGLPRDLGKTVGMIYQNWVPKIPSLFKSNLEIIRYPAGYNPVDLDGSFDYLLPVFEVIQHP